MNFLKRLLTALILLPLLIAVIHYGGLVFTATIIVAGVILSDEIFSMGLGKKHPWRHFFRFMTAIFLLCLVADLNALKGIFGVWFFLFVFGTSLTFRPHMTFDVAGRCAFVLAICLYALLGLLSFHYLREGVNGDAIVGRSFIYLSLVCTFSNDTFAYLVGKSFGKHALFATVSQKKTWEGFMAGAAASIMMPFVLHSLFSYAGVELFLSLTLLDLVFVSSGIALLGPLGDLIESRIKRAFNVKDSGALLPGHGGLFDRVDALLVTVPFTLCYAFFIRPICYVSAAW